MQITTKDGFTCEVDEDVSDDIELLENLKLLDKGGAEASKAIPDIIKSIMGEDGKKAMYDFYRSENGRVKFTVIAEKLPEIFSLIGGNTKK